MILYAAFNFMIIDLQLKNLLLKEFRAKNELSVLIQQLDIK